MLPKGARLTSGEVQEVLSRGTSVYIPAQKGQKSLISLKFLAKTGGFKSSAVAPKSVAKSAVERNRLRRAVYNAILSFPSPRASGYAVFFIRSIPEKPLSRALKPEIGALLEKISSR